MAPAKHAAAQPLREPVIIDQKLQHRPPGTSEWNKIEHRLFSFISINWRGKPLVSFETAVNLIGNTRTRRGLAVKALPDRGEYETRQQLTAEQMRELHLKGHSFHPDWNYTLSPH
jgi:hypothetical protein